MTHDPHSTSPSGGGEPLEPTPVPGWRRLMRIAGQLHMDGDEVRIALYVSDDAYLALSMQWATCDWAEAERRLREYAAYRDTPRTKDVEHGK